jgi:hypothetical protein
MRFLQPDLFYAWVAIIAIPLILYLFRPRPRTVRTSTLPFFMWLAKEHQDNAWLRRLKQILSLLITLAVIMAGVSSLGQLVVSPSEDDLETVVVLIDRSASMSAREKDGPTRMDEALALVRERLAGLPAGVGVSVIAYDRSPEVLLARTVDRRQVERVLDTVKVRPIASEPIQAIRLAKRLAALETPAAVWHVTDFEPDLTGVMQNTNADSDPAIANGVPGNGNSASSEKGPKPDEPSADQLAKVDVKTFTLGLSKPLNAGITAFQIRRVPLQQARLGYEAFVQVVCSSNKEESAELEVHHDGALVQLRKLTLRPGETQTLLIPIDAELAQPNPDEDNKSSDEVNGTEKPKPDDGADRTLTLKLNVAGDVLPEDDVLHAWIPNLPPIRVLWLSENPDPFMELAFSTISSSNDIQMLQGPPSSWPPSTPVDVVIFDGWVPNEWPTDVEVIAFRPPKSIGPIQSVPIPNQGVPIDNLREADSDHPLLYGVATERISVRQRVILDGTGSLQPVWTGPSGPVLVAGESQGQRVIVMAFSPEQSERFPLMMSFPIFLANSVYWAAENRVQESLGINRRTGELQEFDGQSLEWTVPNNTKTKTETIQLAGSWSELDRIGLWKTDTGQRGAEALLSNQETMMPWSKSETDATNKNAITSTSSWLRGDLVPILMWPMLVLLLLDSWLYHRHAV